MRKGLLMMVLVLVLKTMLRLRKVYVLVMELHCVSHDFP